VILVRRYETDIPDDLEMEEFEEHVRQGRITPQHQVCFSVVTGDAFVPASDLEIFQGLYAPNRVVFRHHFHLGRMPWLMLGVIALVLAAFILWQGGAPETTDMLLQQGAKSPSLMIELGQWWRLLSANVLHVSGVHLAVNCLFLLNVGGPAEAVFRRIDLLWILVASALGTTVFSSFANPAVSCGASGIVFGLWGALALFGLRHRAQLPERYQKYFLSSVVPYVVFALYLGFAMDGVDNWGHLGGLVGGGGISYLFPPRLLAQKDRLRVVKLAAAVALPLLLWLANLFAMGAGELSETRHFSRLGLVVAVPARWDLTHSSRARHRETFAFENRAGVTLALEAKRTDGVVDVAEQARAFIAEQLAAQVDAGSVVLRRVQGPEPEVLRHLVVQHIHAELLTEDVPSRADFYVFGRGNDAYVVSLKAPLWLTPHYEAVFASIVDHLQLRDPEDLVTARAEHAKSASAYNAARLALALGRIGQRERALQVLRDAAQRWPAAGDLYLAQARLLSEANEGAEEACDLVSAALHSVGWTPEILRFAVECHRRCDRPEAADKLTEVAKQRFPEF
jgi:rhomboid protease GluP